LLATGALRSVRSTPYREIAMNRRVAVRLLAAALCTIGATAAHAQLPYGPDTCRQGYVWREAYPGDHVCVTPETRAQAADDNRRAPARWQPGGGAYGPYTCRPGFVWREARPGDVVCVIPEIRAQTAADNRQAAMRRAASIAPVPAMGAPQQVQLRTEDSRCEQYASHAVRQYRLGAQRCGVRMDGRWQPNYQNHYQWCLGASNAALYSEQRARDDLLIRCGAVSRID
jgi:hypothetical protein